MNLQDRIAAAKQIDLRDIMQVDPPKYKGHEYWLTYCPFHDDRAGGRPGLMLFRDHFVCLSTNCGVTGDIFVWYNWTKFGSKDRPRGHRFIEVLDTILGEDHVPIVHEEESIEPIEDIDLDRLALEYHKVLVLSPDRQKYFYNRGFTPATVKRQMFGWDGRGFTIPVWEGVPRQSPVLSIRIRSAKTDTEMRYSGIRGYNEQMLYNREALLCAVEDHAPAILILYGEFDAALAWQNGLYAVSPTNGALAVLPEWFTGYDGYKIVVPDKKEERAAFDDAAVFGSKGAVIQFPKEMSGKDFSDFVLKNGGSPKYFVHAVSRQLGIKMSLRDAHV